MVSKFDSYIVVQADDGDDVPELQRKVTAIQHQITFSGVKTTVHDVRLNLLETNSYDGTFLWKIDDFGIHYEEAVTGRVLSICSPQFYIGRYGYKVKIYCLTIPLFSMVVLNSSPHTSLLM